MDAGSGRTSHGMKTLNRVRLENKLFKKFKKGNNSSYEIVVLFRNRDRIHGERGLQKIQEQ